MSVKSLFFKKEEISKENSRYTQELTDEFWRCESDEHDPLDWGHADEDYRTYAMFKDGGLDLNTMLGGGRVHVLPVSTYTYYGNSYEGSYHIEVQKFERIIKAMAKKRKYDTNYQPPKTFADKRWWWNRHGNYTAGLLGLLIGYNVWQYIKSTK